MIGAFSEEEYEQVVSLCKRMGSEDEQAKVMARQLLKRATQLQQERDMTRIEALQHLLELVIRGREGDEGCGCP